LQDLFLSSFLKQSLVSCNLNGNLLSFQIILSSHFDFPMFVQMLKMAFLLIAACFFALPSQAAETARLLESPLEKLQLLHAKIVPVSEGESKLGAQGEEAQLIATFSARPDYHLMLLDAPARLVIDIPQADLAASLEATKIGEPQKGALIRQLSYGVNGAGGARLIVEANRPFTIKDWRIEALHEEIWQLVMDLAAASEQDFAEQSIWLQQNFFAPNLSLGKGGDASRETTSQVPALRPFTIVLDAGHGGFDSGAEGVSGLLEKDVTLAFAHALRAAILEQNPDFSVVLTREDDRFLRLSERVGVARKVHADLFISLHADSIHLPRLRGATIYTISDKASDALAKALAESENKADLLDGLPPDEIQEVTDILVDLTRRETDIHSIRFADELIAQLSRAGVRLIRPSHRYAGFMVLRAPEIPSVLVELGYLSNAQDEKLIADPQWRASFAATMAKAIAQYALDRGGSGGGG